MFILGDILRVCLSLLVNKELFEDFLEKNFTCSNCVCQILQHLDYYTFGVMLFHNQFVIVIANCFRAMTYSNVRQK